MNAQKKGEKRVLASTLITKPNFSFHHLKKSGYLTYVDIEDLRRGLSALEVAMRVHVDFPLLRLNRVMVHR